MSSSKRKSPPNTSGQDKCYFRLWRRFYEPLVLLKILGKTRGEHSPKPEQQSPVHRFLDNLAYLADHQKGGSTTSAIGLENAPEQFNFWIASNETKQSAKSAIFLASILKKVRTIADAPVGVRASLQEKLVRDCIIFAKDRVKKETKMLMKDITRCVRLFTNPDDIELCRWLNQFQDMEPSELCYLAYRERDSLMMKRLSRHLPAHGDLSVIDGHFGAIKEFIHRLGRLAHHIRAPQQIIEDMSNHTGLRNVLDEFQVHSIRPQPAVDRPLSEPDIHIYSIMTRMLPSNGFNAQYKEAADFMNQRFNIVAQFRKQYDDKNFRPLVHAEIQVLEHFWGKRQFFNDDRYIGCSKPACYCCHLYMQYHPARCVVPQTSRNVYLNWGLKALPQGSRDAEYTHQRDILNEMANSIRKDALDQILRKTSAAPWHPDSQTGFTLRAPSIRDEALHSDGQATFTEASRMVDLGEYQSYLVYLCDTRWGLTEIADMATDSNGSQSGSVSCNASDSTHSSLASLSDDSTRHLRNLSWTVDDDGGEESDSSSGGARL
ncbi:hypothetical protein GGR55DRAFT_692588 [Xylaria sp. FL0064]|nr:hypothetical protein GGR55DRAFT_692588 [Xylaria sp. FL0064]